MKGPHERPHPASRSRLPRRRISVGYVPLVDSAPLLIAQTHGFFESYGVDVDLVREIGWATVREKIRHGELECANAPASMVFELSCGLGVLPQQCLTGMATAHHGNSIVLSTELWDAGVRDAHSLARLIRANKGKRRFVFAGVLVYSSQNYLMRKWLRSGGIDPDNDVDMVMVPPPQVHLCLKSGHIDGFCVAEPWGTVSINDGVCWSPELTATLDPQHPEKVFLVRADFDEACRDEHLAMLAALQEAAAFCDAPENRAEVALVLARSEYLDLPEPILRRALYGPYPMGYDRQYENGDVIRFAGPKGNTPSLETARWVLDEIFENGLSEGLSPMSDDEVRNLYREDIFEAAKSLAASHREHIQTTATKAPTFPS